MKNQNIADMFSRMATLLEIQGENVFKIRAYQKAAENIAGLPEDLAALEAEGRLVDIPGVGKALQEKISEYLRTGRMSAYEKLIQTVPESLLEVVTVPSVGPKKAKLFYDQLGIADVAGLKAAAESGRLEGLPGVKQKTSEHILEGIHVLKQGRERMTIAEAATIAGWFVTALKGVKGVKKIEVAGSLRRSKESVHDIDLLVDSRVPQEVMDAFVHLPEVKSIVAHGEKKSSILTTKGVQVDIRVVEPGSFGAAWLYFTGSKSFNVRLRQVAIKLGLKVNEYGIFVEENGQEVPRAGKTEQDCFRALGLPYIPPELREDVGEDRIFSGSGVNKDCRIPKLVELADIKGDLHLHSTWSDGFCSIAEMAAAAAAKGYDYLGVCDHSQRLKVANGLSVEDLKKKKAEIDKLNRRNNNFRILFGTEVEIDNKGELDYGEDVLSHFDIVIAAVHTGFEQDRKQMTARLVKACCSKHVHIIAHPTGVHVGKREASDFDLKAVCRAAADHNTFLEINSFPVRLDLNSQNVYFAQQMGVRFAINTDAHRTEHLGFMTYGVGVARRGWLTKAQVLNTLGLKDLLKALQK